MQFKSMLLAVASMALVGSASAADPFAPSRDYNAVVFGNVTSSGNDSEGRLAVGNDLIATSYGVGSSLAQDLSKYGLVVGHDLNTGASNWQVFSGNVAVGHSVVGSGVTLTGAATLTTGIHPLDFTGLYNYYHALSLALAGLAGNGTFAHPYSTSNLTGTSATLNVFNLTPAQAALFAGASDRQITAPAGSTVVVNVPGATPGMMNGMAVNGTDRTRVIFNFYQATSLSLKSMGVLGSVIAPDAATTLDGAHVDGYSILGGANQINGGEFHNFPSNSIVPVPEPAGVAALGLGLAAALRRRKR